MLDEKSNELVIEALTNLNILPKKGGGKYNPTDSIKWAALLRYRDVRINLFVCTTAQNTLRNIFF